MLPLSCSCAAPTLAVSHTFCRPCLPCTFYVLGPSVISGTTTAHCCVRFVVLRTHARVQLSGALLGPWGIAPLAPSRLLGRLGCTGRARTLALTTCVGIQCTLLRHSPEEMPMVGARGRQPILVTHPREAFSVVAVPQGEAVGQRMLPLSTVSGRCRTPVTRRWAAASLPEPTNPPPSPLGILWASLPWHGALLLSSWSAHWTGPFFRQ